MMENQQAFCKSSVGQVGLVTWRILGPPWVGRSAGSGAPPGSQRTSTGRQCPRLVSREADRAGFIGYLSLAQDSLGCWLVLENPMHTTYNRLFLCPCFKIQVLLPGAPLFLAHVANGGYDVAIHEAGVFPFVPCRVVVFLFGILSNGILYRNPSSESFIGIP